LELRNIFRALHNEFINFSRGAARRLQIFPGSPRRAGLQPGHYVRLSIRLSPLKLRLFAALPQFVFL
jgi:hypothetical protein